MGRREGRDGRGVFCRGAVWFNVRGVLNRCRGGGGGGGGRGKGSGILFCRGVGCFVFFQYGTRAGGRGGEGSS